MLKDKRGRGQAKNVFLAVMIVFILLALVGGLFYFMFVMYPKTTQSTVGQSTSQIISQTTEQSKIGKASTIKVDVNNVGTSSPFSSKLATTVYCIDDQGNYVISGTTSSTSTTISGSTTIGKTISCYALNATTQTLPDQNTESNKKYISRNIDEETEQISIEAFIVPNNTKIETYDSQLATGNGTDVNITGVGADSTGTADKVRVTNNNSNTILPLGGLYFSTVTGTNISYVDIEGTALLHLKGSSWLPSTSSAKFVKSDLANGVSSRNDNWENVYEIDTGAKVNDKKSALFLEGGDYIETTTVSIKGDGDGCSSNGADQITPEVFTKGYFQGAKSSSILYGHQTDASSSAVITVDMASTTKVDCRA